MPTWLIVFLFALGAVALFVVGMSLTLMIKGHHIDSEISTNETSQRLGIRCAVQESREDFRTNRLRRRGLFGQLLGMRHRTDNEKRGVTLLFFISIALLEPYQDVLIKVDP